MRLTIPEAQFSNMNVRAEKSGDDIGEGAVDLTFEAELSLDDAVTLFGASSKAAHTWLRSLYADGGKGDELTVPSIGPIKVSAEFEPVTVAFEPEFLEAMDLARCRLDKVVVTPDFAQRIGVKFRIQGHPTPQQVGHLYELQGRDLGLTVAKQQGDLPLESEQEETEDAEA